MYDFRCNTGLVCHDAGAANILIAAFKENAVLPVWALMQGPAKVIWELVFPHIRCDFPLSEIIRNASCLYTGSGWASTLEFDAIVKARSSGLFCVSVIDHWVNYSERFYRDGHRAWPDRFLVTDLNAYNIACEIFPAEQVLLGKNFYLENQVRKIVGFSEPKDQDLLFICEPMRNTWGREVEGEFQVLNHFFKTLEGIKVPESLEIVLRLHPSESAGKYDDVRDQTHFVTKVSDRLDIADDIARSSIVVGCNSYGLVVALTVGTPTYNALPPWAPKSVLPHSGIMPLSELSFNR